MAIFPLTQPFLRARQLRGKAGLVMAMTILVFIAIRALLIGSAFSEDDMLTALVGVGLVSLLIIAVRRALVSRDAWLETPSFLILVPAAMLAATAAMAAGG